MGHPAKLAASPVFPMVFPWDGAFGWDLNLVFPSLSWFVFFFSFLIKCSFLSRGEMPSDTAAKVVSLDSGYNLPHRSSHTLCGAGKTPWEAKINPGIMPSEHRQEGQHVPPPSVSNAHLFGTGMVVRGLIPTPIPVSVPPPRSHPSFKHLIRFVGSVSSEDLFYFVIVSLGSVMAGGGVPILCVPPRHPPPGCRVLGQLCVEPGWYLVGSPPPQLFLGSSPPFFFSFCFFFFLFCIFFTIFRSLC